MFTKSKKSSSAVVTELLRKPKMIGTVELEKEKKVQIFKWNLRKEQKTWAVSKDFGEFWCGMPPYFGMTFLLKRVVLIKRNKGQNRTSWLTCNIWKTILNCGLVPVQINRMINCGTILPNHFWFPLRKWDNSCWTQNIIKMTNETTIQLKEWIHVYLTHKSASATSKNHLFLKVNLLMPYITIQISLSDTQ